MARLTAVSGGLVRALIPVRNPVFRKGHPANLAFAAAGKPCIKMVAPVVPRPRMLARLVVYRLFAMGEDRIGQRGCGGDKNAEADEDVANRKELARCRLR